MSAPGKPIPDGYHTVTPYLTIRGASAAIQFYEQAFGARELMRMPAPDGRTLMHAEIKIGDSIVMLSDEFPDYGALSPAHYGGTTVANLLYVEDCDAVHDRAVAAGARTLQPPMDMFWGDRMATIVDPYGHKWSIGTHKLDLTPEEIAAAAKAAGSA